MSKEEQTLLEEIRNLMAMQQESVAQVNSSLFHEFSDKLDSIEVSIKELKECTQNTPIVNKAVFTFVGIVVVGVISAFMAIVVAKFNSIFIK